MVRRSAGTTLLALGAAATAVGLGGGAIAGPGAPTTELVPPSELGAGGGAAAPGAVTPDGAVEAPAAAPAPAPAEPAPPVGAPPAAVAPEVPTDAAPVPGDTVTPEELPSGEAEEAETDAAPAEPEADAEKEPVEEPIVPTSAEVLSEAMRPLVPVAILSAPVESASEGDPLIADGEVLAEAAQQGDGDGEGNGQGEDEPENDDDGEIIIPVDPDDEPDDGEETPPNGDEDGTLQPGGAPQTMSRGDRLALTGLAVEGPLGAGIVLLLLGTWLRMTARPISAPAQA